MMHHHHDDCRHIIIPHLDIGSGYSVFWAAVLRGLLDDDDDDDDDDNDGDEAVC